MLDKIVFIVTLHFMYRANNRGLNNNYWEKNSILIGLLGVGITRFMVYKNTFKGMYVILVNLLSNTK